MCVLSIGLLSLVGCDGDSTQKDDSCLPIVFEHPSVDLGRTIGQLSLNHEFVFHVTSNDGAVISKLASSCGCMTVDKSIVGKRLSFGEKHTISIQIPANEKAGRLEGIVLVTTSPSASEPIMLKLSGFVTGLPRIVDSTPIYVESTVGKSSDFHIQVARVRSREQENVSLDLQRSNFGPYKLSGHKITLYEERRNGAQMEDGVRELHLIDLHGSALHKTGKYDDRVKIAWNGEIPQTMVDIVRRVRHDYQLQVDNPFLGVLRAGEQKEFRFSFACRTSDLSHLKIHLPVDSVLNARCDCDAQQLFVTLTAPLKTGRFNEKIVLYSCDGNAAPLEVEFSGIVE